FGGRPAALHFVERGNRGKSGNGCGYRNCRDCPCTLEGFEQVGNDSHDSHASHVRHGLTVTAVFGNSPNISGAYIASTCVGGNSKRPALFRRTLYSTTHVPFGTKR